MSISRKKKTCVECGNEEYIFSKGRCKRCASLSYSKPKATKKNISPFSKKKLSQLSEYRTVRNKFLEEHPLCQANVVKECAYYAGEVHHKRGRVGDDLTDVNNFLAVCRACHTYIETHPEESYAKGLSVKRI